MSARVRLRVESDLVRLWISLCAMRLGATLKICNDFAQMVCSPIRLADPCPLLAHGLFFAWRAQQEEAFKATILSSKWAGFAWRRPLSDTQNVTAPSTGKLLCAYKLPVFELYPLLQVCKARKALVFNKKPSMLGSARSGTVPKKKPKPETA